MSQPATDTPAIEAPRMQLATALEIAIGEGFPLRGSVMAIATIYGITAPDRAIYEQAA